MASGSNESGVEVNRALLVSGVVLLSTAALLGTVGGIAVTIAVVGAARSWTRQLDEPPSALARRRMAQARSAALAGAQGWRQHGAAIGTQNGSLSPTVAAPDETVG